MRRRLRVLANHAQSQHFPSGTCDVTAQMGNVASSRPYQFVMISSPSSPAHGRVERAMAELRSEYGSHELQVTLIDDVDGEIADATLAKADGAPLWPFCTYTDMHQTTTVFRGVTHAVCIMLGVAVTHALCTILGVAPGAYGTLTPRMIAAATQLRWVQCPMAAPPESYFSPELQTREDITVTNMRGIYDQVRT
eukprot:SAG11_NODE_1671_length_4486_cov_1.735127_2_plen_194_part_00